MMSRIIYLIGCLFAMTALASCKKSDSYDVKGEEKVKFYTRNETAGNAPPNSISYAVVNYPDPASTGWLNLSTSLTSAIKFPVFATKPVSQDVEIRAALDNSLVAAYNAAHNTNYEPFPVAVLNTDAIMQARILKGETRSSDSISIPTNLNLLTSLIGKTYMAPIKLFSVSNPAVGEITSSETHTTYIMVSVEMRRIKFNAVAADAIGTLITPRTGWSIIFTPAPTTTGSVIDGSTTTFSRWSASPVQVDVNLQTARNVTGLRLYTSNNATHIPTQVEVSLSNDGINYDVIGSPLKANLTYASSYNYILFYKPIQAKYIKIRNFYTTSTNTQNLRLTELDVYAN